MNVNLLKIRAENLIIKGRKKEKVGGGGREGRTDGHDARRHEKAEVVVVARGAQGRRLQDARGMAGILSLFFSL